MKTVQLALVLAVSVAAMAQGSGVTGMAGMAMPAMHEIPPPEKLPVPKKMSGLGNSHITIKATPEAQMWFDQGLNLLHDFWDYESAKAFEQGVRVDPNCAMCYWGLAQVEGFRGGPEKVYGTKALAEAVRLKGRESGAGKLYIEAAVASSQAKDEDSKAEIAAYRKLVKKHPEELQARLFLALAQQDGYDKGELKAGTKEAKAELEAILRDKPDDSATNHYWIHLMEPSNHPEEAIKSAQMLAAAAPTSGHMVHMPGHIFYRVGDYKEADHWFAASTETDERYMREQHVSPDDDWNYVHNMTYGIANLMEQGRLADANALSDRLSGARGELGASLYIGSARDSMARLNNRIPVALRVGDWNGMLAMLDAAPKGDAEKAKNLNFLAEELKDFALGMQAFSNKDLAVAEAASARLDAGLWRQSQQKNTGMKMGASKTDAAAKPEAKKDAPAMEPIMPDAMAPMLVKSLGLASLELRAGVLAARGKLDEAKKLYAQAEKTERDLGYREPPLYVRPVGETEGAALLAAKDFAGARAAYEAALVDRPASGFGLFGLAQVKEMSGDRAGAKAAYLTFLKAWPQADAGLPQVMHAKQFVEGGAAAGEQ